MRSVNFSGNSISKFTLWRPSSDSVDGLERTAVIKAQYQSFQTQPAKRSTTEAPKKLSFLKRLKNAFKPREEHVKWMEKSHSGLDLTDSMLLGLLENAEASR